MANLATRLIDRFVGALNPDAGMRRLRARELLTRAHETDSYLVCSLLLEKKNNICPTSLVAQCVQS